MRKTLALILSIICVVSLVSCKSDYKDPVDMIPEEGLGDGNSTDDGIMTLPDSIPVEDGVTWDLIPMVMINDELYLDTGCENNGMLRCGTPDGKIISTVDGSQKPIENNQSNFGSGFGYQYGFEPNTIEIYMNEGWRVFAKEDYKEEIQKLYADRVVFEGRVFKRSELSNDTLEWLEWYNSLDYDTQLAVSFVPPELIDRDEIVIVEDADSDLLFDVGQ